MSKFIKAIVIFGLVLAALCWLSYRNPSQSAQISPGQVAKFKSEDYIGSDACKDCHEDQFKNFSHTSHAQLTKLASWKEKITGCESCHGPGKAHSEEGDTECLGIFNLPVKKFTQGKVPHMGWNSLTQLRSPLMPGLKEGDYCYFVHSYYAALSDDAIAITNYGIPFSSALHKNNFYGVQFHAEKSAAVGEQILKNFLAL